ncbi:MAG TPA: TRAP transporter fused permease subunit [Clostridia bacterium]|nr:TRAP transporter fused permease subunit [Clostridia bacterium]
MGYEEFKQAKEEVAESVTEIPIISHDNTFNRIIDTSIVILSVALGLFHVYTGIFGLEEFYIQRGVHLLLVLLISSLILMRESKNIVARVFYSITLLGVVIPYAFFYGNFSYYQTRLWGIGFTQRDIITGIILVITIFVLSQRCIGWVMPIIAALSIVYLVIGNLAPGILQHGGYSFKFITELCSWSEMGIFSTPIGVAASYLYLFILFGTLIERMGTGNTLIELAKSIAGRQKGGPAKIAVVSSAMMGSISGSPIANVLTTGAFTIPLMKKLGFEPAYAAAVEAVASTGGMILPPVMGVLAFAMVDYAGVPYSRIILCAAIPAILYYIAAFFTVHFHSLKLDMKPLEKHEMQPIRKVLKDGWLTLVPILILAVPLMMGYTPLATVSWATVSLIPVSFFGDRSRWLTPGTLVQCFVKSAKNMRIITLPCALAGIVSGALSVTGVGVRLSSILLSVANGNLFVLLLLVALITIIMGCGLPSLLAYIIQLPITIPAIIAMGVPAVGAHLFVVYYSTLAFITPPVGMSLFAAAGLANSSYMKTGWNAVKIGAAGFMVPFIFIYCPSLLLLDINIGILFDILVAVLSTYVLSVSIEGFLFENMNMPVRLLCFATSIMLFSPSRILGIAGIAITVIVTVLSKVRYRNNQKLKVTL